MRGHRQLLALALLLAPGAVHAEDFRSTTTVSPLDHNDELYGGATPLEVLGARTGAASLADTVRRAPGARVRSAGAPGSPQWISLRASAPWQVGVYLDGIPLHGADAAAVDLALLPASLISEMVVYRGSLPVALGPPLPGGAVELRTRFEPDDGEQIVVGAGSFATRRATAVVQRRHASVDWLLGAHYAGSSGRFRYFDNNGTTLDSSDDGTSVRRNAAHDRGNLLGRLRVRAGAWRITNVLIADAGSEGVPGQVGAEALRASVSRYGARLGSTADRRVPEGRLRMLVHGGFSRHELDDPASELGFGAQQREETTVRGGLSLQPRWDVAPSVVVAGVAEAGVEDLSIRDRLDDVGLDGALRTTAAAGAEVTAEAVPERMRLRAAGRFDLQHDGVRGEASTRSASGRSVDWIANASLGAVATLVQREGGRLALRMDAGTAGRMPSFVERFGDRGTFVGNRALVPERRVGGEIGLHGQIDVDAWQLMVEAAAFARRTSEQIVWVENGVGVATPQNLERVRAVGSEAALGVSWAGHVGLDVAHTWMRARDISDNSGDLLVPWLPSQWIDARLSGGIDWVRVEVGADHVTGFPLDRQGLRRVPPRTLLHALVRATLPPVTGLQLEVRVDNLLDLREQDVPVRDGGREVLVPRAIADFTAMPLPGRAVWVTLAWQRSAAVR